MITSAQLARLANIDPKTIAFWVDRGQIKPAVSGRRQPGASHLFAIPTAVGVIVAGRIMNTVRGCHAKYSALIMSGFAGMTEEEIDKRVKEGRTHFLTVSGPHVILGPQRYPDQISVVEVLGELRELTDRPVKVGPVGGSRA